MKAIRYSLLLLLILPVSLAGQGITIGSGTTFSLGNAKLALPGHWTNKGTFVPGSGTIVLNGSGGDQTITNASEETFGNLTINKAAGDVKLANNVIVNGLLLLTSGDIDLSEKVIELGGSALVAETPGNTIKGLGSIIGTASLNAPSAANVFGLGALITSPANLGSTTIIRTHVAQTGKGNTGILRSYNIAPALNIGLQATLAFTYDDSELNGKTESKLQLFKSTSGGTFWKRMGGTADPNQNTVTLSGINDFSLWTLGEQDAPLSQDSVWVTFIANTATVPDTLKPNSFVQVRGSAPSLGPWNQTSPALLANIGGDYWTGTFKFRVGDTIQYKYFTHVLNPLPAGQENSGWEMDLYHVPALSNNRFLIVGLADTTLPLEFVNGSPSNQLQYWRPYVDQPDSIDVRFRVNMQSMTSFIKASQFMGVRGGTLPLGWTMSVVLAREQQHGNSGTPYDGTNFWSGTVRFPVSAFASNIEYQFVILGSNDPMTPVLQWETDIPNRVLSSNPSPHDTTLAWKWWDDRLYIPTPPPLSPMVGAYRADASTTLLLHLDEADGAAAYDSSGAGNNGSAVGTGIVSGRFGRARSFNGSSDFIDLGKPLLSAASPTFTIEAWAKVDALPILNSDLFSNGKSLNMFFGVRPYGHLIFGVRSGTGPTKWDTSRTAIPIGRWVHCAAVYDAANGKMLAYANGRQMIMINVSGFTPGTADTSNSYIGRGNPAFFFTGAIDEVRLSSVVRSPQEFNLHLPPVQLAGSTSGTTVNLSWQDAGGGVSLSKYRIYRGLDSINVALIDSTLSTSFANTGVPAGQAYFYRVSSVDVTGFESAMSDACVSGTPAAPMLLAPAPSAAGVLLPLTAQWNPSGGAQNYRIQVSSVSDFSSLAADLSNITGTAVGSIQLSGSSTFYWRVSASNSAGTSDWSEVRSFTTQVIVPPPIASKWQFVRSFFSTTLNSSGVQGLATDPEGKVWIASYGNADSILTATGYRMVRVLYVLYPNGTPAPFSPMKIITGPGITDTLFGAGGRGLTTDPQGNILYSCNNTLYRIDYKTGLGMGKASPAPSATLTAAATDANGNIFVGRVLPANPIQVFASNFSPIGPVDLATTGYSRSIGVTSSGVDVYWPEYTNRILYKYHTAGGVSGPYVKSDSMLPGLAIESMTRHPLSGQMWVSSGSNFNPPVPPWPKQTWFALDPATKQVVDTIAWNLIPGTEESRPRGIAFSPTGDTAYVGCFQVNQDAVQMFVRGVPQGGVLRLAPYTVSGKYLNQQIAEDTLANGKPWNRVYELQRGGLYLANAVFASPGNWTLRIRANDSTTTKKPVVMLYPTNIGLTPWNPPSYLFQINGNLELRNLQISGYYELVDTNRWNMQGALIDIPSVASGINITIDSCILSNTNGNHIRTDGPASVIRITNTVFANMGYLGRSNFGAGKAVDLRATSCDSLIMTNNTFVNSQDRIVRHFATGGGTSTGTLNYFLFDHNTLVNGTSFHGLLSLGTVGNRAIVMNNLFLDAFAMGNDSDATRQAEYTPSGELDQYGKPRMTWIFSYPGATTWWTVANNYYGVSDSGQSFYNQYASVGVTGEGSPLTWQINRLLGADSVNAFRKISFTLNKVPALMTQLMRWYRAPNGGNKTKNTPGAWVYGTATDPNDFDRKGYSWLRDSLNCSYSTSLSAYNGGTGGFPAGDLNWFPGQKAAWPGLILPSGQSSFAGEYQTDAPTALLMHFNEQGGTSVADESGHNNNGTATGTTIVSGRFGRARWFNGSGDLIAVPNSSSVNILNAITIEAWVFDEGGGGWACKYEGPLSWDMHRNAFFISRDGVENNSLNFNMPLNRWVHVGAVYDGSEQRVYIDGELVASRSWPGSIASSNSRITIGTHGNQWFRGTVDEMRISNIARTPDQFNVHRRPKNLTLSISGTTVNLSWQDGGGRLGLLQYRIYRGSHANNFSFFASTTSTSYSDVNIPVGSAYYYRVTAVDSTGFEGNSTDFVCTVPRTLTLTSPNGGEAWASGTQHNITWTSSSVDSVRLEYTTDNGTNWSMITGSTPAALGGFLWTVPTALSVKCNVRITDITDATLTDVSDNLFKIYKSTGLFVATANNLGVTTVNGQFSCAWGDYDGDGYLDLYIPGAGYPNTLYHNDGGTHFVDMTAAAGLVGPFGGAAFGAIWLDIDRDGDLDLLCTDNGLKLYRNDGSVFTDITVASNLNTIDPGVALWQVVAGDFDKDGDMDLALAGANGNPLPIRILRNDNGVFTNVAPAMGINRSLESWNPAWVDVNNDGNLDLWLPTIRAQNAGCTLLMNQGGQLVVSDTNVTGLKARSAIASSWADFNGDGDMDLFLIPLSTDNDGVAKLYRNNGDGTFTDVAQTAGLNLAFSDARGAYWGDFDNDGDLDLLIGSNRNNQKLYRNDGGYFVEVGAETGAGFTGGFRSAVFVDYDNDGKLDIYYNEGQSNSGGQSKLLLRNAGSSNHWIGIRPKGIANNTAGIGARVTVVAGSLRQVRDIQAGAGGITNGDLRAHVGLGAATSIDSVIVRWPKGNIDIYKNLAVNSYNTVVEVAPSPPKNLVAMPGDARVTLKWSTIPEPGFLRYRIYGGTTPHPTSLIDSTNSLNDTTKTISGLSNGTIYYYRVTAVNSKMVESFPSNEASTTPSSIAGARAVLLFGGQNVQVSDVPQIANAMTVEAWVYPVLTRAGTLNVVRRALTTALDTSGVYMLQLYRDSIMQQPAVRFSLPGTPAGNMIFLDSSHAVIPNFAWSHIAGTYAGDTLRVFVNGVEMYKRFRSGALLQGGITRFGSSFSGFIDEVKVWNVARTGAQIQAGMSGLVSPQYMPELIGYWKFEETNPTSTTPVADWSPSSKSGRYMQGANTYLFSPFDPPGAPSISMAPPTLDYGTTESGEFGVRTVTVTNNGTSALVVLNPTTSRILVLYPTQSQIEPIRLLYRAIGNLDSAMAIPNNATGMASSVHLTASASLEPKYFDVNSIRMAVMRDGRIGVNPIAARAGTEWPKGSGKTVVYQFGLMLAGQVGADTRTGVAYYNSEYQAGGAPGGIPSTPSSQFHVFKISSGDNAGSNPDYANWPSSLGAPSNPDGSPKLLGDQTMFTIYNDLNPDLHNTYYATNTFGSAPLGAEVRQTVYGFNRPDAFGNTVLIKYRIVNRSTAPWNNTYFGMWADPDVGNAGDDRLGSDVARNTGYVYNAQPTDTAYGSNPPAAGFVYLKGPGAGKPLSTFSYFVNGGSITDPNNQYQVYNHLRGVWRDGSTMYDPSTGQPTTYAYSGDPVNNTGWVDYDNPADVRIVLGSGPVNLAAGDSVDLEFAVVIGQGANNLSSISAMRNSVDAVKTYYASGQTTLPPAAPQSVVAAAGDREVTLKWSRSADANFLRYRIFGGTSPNPTTQIDSAGSVGDTVRVFTNLVNQTTYYYRVKVVSDTYRESEFSQEVSATPSSVAGIRSAMLATGNANIRVLNSPNVSTAVTVEAWIYPMKMDENDAVIFRRYKNSPVDSTFVYSLSMHRASAGEQPSLLFVVSDGTPSHTSSLSSGATTIPFFGWTHVAGLYDGSSLRLFINGQPAGQTSASIAIPSASDIRMGVNVAPAVAQRFFGFIDEVKHWNIGRTQSEIQAGMNGLVYPAAIPGLIGYWKMEEPGATTGTVLVDHSASKNNGDYRASATTVVFTPFDAAGTRSIALNPTSLDYGVSERGEPLNRSVSVTNGGTAALVGYFSTDGGFAVAAGQNGMMNVPAPLDNQGQLLASVAVYSNAPSSPSMISVSGTILQPKTLDVNNIKMYALRNGRTNEGPYFGPAFEWPKGSGKSPLYASGLWVAAQVNGTPTKGVVHYNSEYQAGPAPGGTPVDPSNTRYRVYKVSKGDNAGSNPDYAQWPGDLGAPVNVDGTPKVLGDQTLFAAYNDLNAGLHGAYGGGAPLGAEVRQTTYGYNLAGAIQNTVFIRYKIINRSNQTWANAYAALWSDADLGDAYDDLAGCDVNRDLVYVYNGAASDNVYGSAPPAIGYVYLKGPVSGKTLRAFSYMAVNDPSLPDPSNPTHFYNDIQGKKRDGSSFIDPNTGQATVYPLSGDPVTGTGWNDANAADRRIVASAGPFNLVAGDSTEVVFAIVAAQGASSLNSISALRNAVDEIRFFYQGETPHAPSLVRSAGVGGDWGVSTTWIGGIVPTSADTAVIADGDSVTLNVSAGVANLRIGDGASGVLVFSNTTPVKLTVTGNVLVNTGATFRCQNPASGSVIDTLYVYGDLINLGSVFDMRSMPSPNYSVCNIAFVGSSNSLLKSTGPYSPNTNEFNGILINKTGGARAILGSDISLPSGNSSYPESCPYLDLRSGIVETGTHILIHRWTLGSSIINASSNSYIFGTLGRGMTNLSNSTYKTFPVGDNDGYRPIKIRCATGGVATGHNIRVRLISGNANTGSSTLTGGIDRVAAVRYYKVGYDQGENPSAPSTMSLDRFYPSYGQQDGVAAGNSNLRVAYSLNDRQTWSGFGQTIPDTTRFTDPPAFWTPDSLPSGSWITLSSNSNNVLIALARLAGTYENSLGTVASLPSSWAFTANTGSNATVGVPYPINPTTGTRPLQTGDVVGVFFQRNDSLICAGYSVWQDGQSLAITAWGDNSQTGMKDGFAEGELIRFKIWDAQAGKALQALVEYQMGGTTYTNNGIYLLNSLVGVTSIAHSIILPPGWNMISSFVTPKDSTLDSIFVKIKPRIVIAKNGAGQVYWPALSINSIGKWKRYHGYQIYMQLRDTLTVTGEEINPQQLPIIVPQGWNLVSYLRNGPMRSDSALTSIAGSLVIAKNGAGQVYWPALSINQIGNMKPGAGYQMYLSSGGTLSYPANAGSSPPSIITAAKVDESVALSKSADGENVLSISHYPVMTRETGGNATLSIEGRGISDGDEIGVWGAGGLLVGSGTVAQGRAVVTVWGDDVMTEGQKEGATDGEGLTLKVWQKTAQKEKFLTIGSVTDGLTARKMEGGLKYVADGAWIVEVTEAREIPTVFSLDQNYPNPFNPTTTIRYGLPKDARVALDIYNVLGQKVMALVDEDQKAGYHQMLFNASSLSSGVYFYTIRAADFRETKKLMLLK